MINFRIIARVLSQVLISEGIFMLAAGALSWIYREEAAVSFLYSAIITLVTGALVFTPLRKNDKPHGTREGYLIMTLIWLVFGLFGSLPYLLTSSAGNFTDAFFESVSGFTTTGASVFNYPELLPKGILFWRSLTQWMGGIAIIMLSSYLIPVTNTMTIQLPTSDFSGHITDKVHPKIIETGKRLLLIYTSLTLVEVILLLAGKMPLFDAVCHSMSTLSTGGFSTRNGGMSTFSSPFIKAVVTIFMFVAGTNMSLFYFVLKKNYSKLLNNNEFRIYGLLTATFSVIFVFILILIPGKSFLNALSDGFFHVISIISTTGFYTDNYANWGDLAVAGILFLMFIGAMSGSAGGGIKIIRFMILGQNSRNELKKLIHTHAYLPVHVDQKKVPSGIIANIMVFAIIYLIMVCTGSLLLSLLDFDLITAFSTSASMLANIGPSLGTFSPFENYSALPATGKWILSTLMVAGRLELLAVIIIFTRSFHKR